MVDVTRADIDAASDALDVLSNLYSYLGTGMGDDNTTAEQFDKRIRWGIDHLACVAIQRCADVVEECSRQPGTRWGQIKARILALKSEYSARNGAQP